MLSRARRSPIGPFWPVGLLRQQTDTGRPSNVRLWQSLRQRRGHGRSSVRPWRMTSGWLSRSALSTLCTVGWCADVVKYFEDLLPPTRLLMRKQSPGTRRWALWFLGLKLLRRLTKLLGGRAPRVDQICPEFFKALGVVGLSWLTRLWTSGVVRMTWQTRVVVPLFKKGNWTVCSNYRKITLLNLPGKVYSEVQERRACLID